MLLLSLAVAATPWEAAATLRTFATAPHIEAWGREEILSLHVRPSLAPMAAASSAAGCNGLTAAAVQDASAASFQSLCRVVDSKFGVISAEILFNLRRDLATNDASAALAFQQLFADDAANAAELISHAVGEHKSYGRMTVADPAMASVIHQAAQDINMRKGGLYEATVCCHDRYTRAARCIRACIGNCCILLYNSRNRPIQHALPVPPDL